MQGYYTQTKMKETVREAVWTNRVGEKFNSSRCKKCLKKIDVFSFDVNDKNAVVCGHCTGASGIKKKRAAVWKYRAGKEFNMKCPIYKCKNILTPFQFEVCHIQARAKGGEDDLENLHIGCSSCNRRMGTKNFWEYHQEVLKLHGAKDETPYDVECIVDEKFEEDLFQVKWKKWPDCCNSWEPRESFEGCPETDYVWRT